MPADASMACGSKHEQESLLPELLHALNQPLTSLRCSLEVTLLQPRDSEEYRRRLRESLKLTEDITVLASGIRELIEVEQLVPQPCAVSFEKVLQFSLRELMPLADSEGVGMSLLCAPSLTALGDEQQLSTAVIYLLSFLLNRASKGEELNIQAKRDGEQIALAFELSKSSSQGSDAKIPAKPVAARAYLRLLVARRIFEVSGGTVQVELGGRQVSIQIRLPRFPSRQEEPAMLTCDEPSAEITERKDTSRIVPFRKVLPR